MNSKILLVRVNLLVTTLSGSLKPLHCRDIQALPGAYDALACWSKWGYTILGLSDQSAVTADGKSFGLTLEELSYTIYCFPSLEAIYFDIGAVAGGICRLDSVNCCCIDQTSDSFLANVLASVFRAYSVDPTDTWVASDLPEDENIASSHGVNAMAGDVWRVCLDTPPTDCQPLVVY